MKHFIGKNILVTGAGSGIGKETALAFARRGANLFVVDVNEAAAEQTCQAILAEQGVARSFVCDVSDPEAMKQLAEQVHEQVDALDVLVNNAGIGAGGRFLDTTLETWNRVLSVNLMGVVHGCHVFLPAMVAAGRGGHVVNLASLAGYLAVPDMPVYSASKFAVLGFSESLRADMAQHNIGVTAICPGIINTDIVKNTVMEGALAEQPDAHDKVIAFYQKRNYTPDKVAREIVRAVEKNQAVRPVSPESWVMYYGKRFFPGLVGKLTQAKNPFL